MSTLYPSFKVALLRGFLFGELFPNPAVLKVCFVGPSFVYISTHETLDDISGIEAAGVEIPSVQVTPNAVVIGNNLIPALSEIPAPFTLEGFVVYLEDTVTGDTRLVGHIDTLVDGDLPQLIDTESINLRWPAGGIFGI